MTAALAGWFRDHVHALRGCLICRPPAGVTHVLAHMPAVLTDPPGTGPGWWELRTTAEWVSGAYSDCTPEIDGPAGTDQGTLRVFAEQTLGYPVTLDRHEIDYTQTDGTPIGIEPFYYLTPAGAGR